MHDMRSGVALKSTAVAYLILFIFGWLGGHKFYLGRPVMGLLYFFTFGLFGIGLLFDLITLPDQVKTANMQIMIMNGGSLGSSQNVTVVNNIGTDSFGGSRVFAANDYEQRPREPKSQVVISPRASSVPPMAKTFGRR